MGRVTKIWQDVRKPQNYATMDSSPSDSYTDQVQWNLGKMYERQDVSTHRYVQDDSFGQTHTEDAAGLYDFRNRWYAPRSGGWLSRDPLGVVDSENLYQAFFGGPIHRVDYYGKCVEYSIPTDYGLLKFRACNDPGGSAAFDNRCKDQAGCTEHGCKRVGDNALCVIHVKVDCKHPAAKKVGCFNVWLHEFGHALRLHACISDPRFGIPEILRQFKDGEIDGDQADADIKELMRACGEAEFHYSVTPLKPLGDPWEWGVL